MKYGKEGSGYQKHSEPGNIVSLPGSACSDGT